MGGVGFRYGVVGRGSEDGPVDCIEVCCWIALTDRIVNPAGKVRLPVVGTPVDQVLWWVEGMGRIAGCAVAELAGGFVGGTETPDLCASRFGLPCLLDGC